MEEGATLAEAVGEARAQALAETDVRLDLGGHDVLMKARGPAFFSARRFTFAARRGDLAVWRVPPRWGYSEARVARMGRGRPLAQVRGVACAVGLVIPEEDCIVEPPFGARARA